MITEGYYYIDKTLFIKELLDKKGEVNLFARPRRFGKSLNISMLQYFFDESKKINNEAIKWTGTIKNVWYTSGWCEFDLDSRGNYYHVIIGKHKYGNYVCIPNWDIGYELSEYTDLFWNTERLARQFKEIDAITVATAIKELNNLLQQKPTKHEILKLSRHEIR